MPALNVNTDAVVALTRRLERMRKSDFPVTVRKSLNSVAKYNRNVDLPDEFSKSFTRRNKSTVKHFSWTQNAEGWNVSNMRSTSGFIDKGKSFSDDMIKQEFGGTIERSIVHRDESRVSKSLKKNVKADNRLRTAGRFNKRGVAKGDKKKLRKVVNKLGVGRLVLYGKLVFRIDETARGKGGLRMSPVFSYVPGGTVKVGKNKGTVRRSGTRSGQRMERIFISEAKKRILKK